MEGKVVGAPEMWTPVHQKYRPLFDVAVDCTNIFNQIRGHPGTIDLLPLTVMRMMCAAVNSFGAIQILVLNGYGADALKLTRSIYETELNIIRLKNHPDEIHDFMEYRAIRRKKAYDQMDDAQKLRVPKAAFDEIHSEYTAALPRFANKNNKPRNEWCKVTLRERAIDAGMLELHDTYYQAASSMHHGDVMGLLDQADSD